MKNLIDDLFNEMAENNRRLSLMLNKGLSYEDSMRILYGDTFDEAQEIVKRCQQQNEDDEEKETPAMTLLNSETKKEIEPKQNS